MQALLYGPAGVSLFISQLITQNDTQFKRALDGYKYPEKYPQKTQIEYRAVGEVFLADLESLLQKSHYLFADKPSLADYAIFPFVRQFAAVDSAWFALAPYPKLHAWLNEWANSDLFMSIMTKNPTYVG